MGATVGGDPDASGELARAVASGDFAGAGRQAYRNAILSATNMANIMTSPDPTDAINGAAGFLMPVARRKPQIISSQRHIDDEIVAEKLKSGDFEVTLSPEFEYAGGLYQVLLDGHHRLAAAKRAGVEPSYVVATPQTNDRVGLIRSGEIEDFLRGGRIDSDYYDVETGHDIW